MLILENLLATTESDHPPAPQNLKSKISALLDLLSIVWYMLTSF